MTLVLIIILLPAAMGLLCGLLFALFALLGLVFEAKRPDNAEPSEPIVRARQYPTLTAARTAPLVNSKVIKAQESRRRHRST